MPNASSYSQFSIQTRSRCQNRRKNINFTIAQIHDDSLDKRKTDWNRIETICSKHFIHQFPFVCRFYSDDIGIPWAFFRTKGKYLPWKIHFLFDAFLFANKMSPNTESNRSNWNLFSFLEFEGGKETKNSHRFFISLTWWIFIHILDVRCARGFTNEKRKMRRNESHAAEHLFTAPSIRFNRVPFVRK